MKFFDFHNHSTFSADGACSLERMLFSAEKKGLAAFGTAEHFDYDYKALGLTYENGRFLDEDSYFSTARALQKNAPLRYFVGAEFGFLEEEKTLANYCATAKKYQPDFIVNSVHVCDGQDCWFSSYFEGKDKTTSYSNYLKAVRKSLDAPYPYHIVAHVGYVSRNAPYADAKIRYQDFPDLYDDILSAVIEKGKILEVNTSARGAGSAFLPDLDVLSRYRALGGRKVCISSDAHDEHRIANGFEECAKALFSVGFSVLTYPTPEGEVLLPLDEF
ncbi:MAG: histidinol-phosphatase HisJ family protein [Clostridia bacterium]|nr:histidinol-phosphatase HisJ family protein [Clostridia bacterium]